jgi:hypothetical protein
MTYATAKWHGFVHILARPPPRDKSGEKKGLGRSLRLASLDLPSHPVSAGPAGSPLGGYGSSRGRFDSVWLHFSLYT